MIGRLKPRHAGATRAKPHGSVQRLSVAPCTQRILPPSDIRLTGDPTDIPRSGSDVLMERVLSEQLDIFWASKVADASVAVDIRRKAISTWVWVGRSFSDWTQTLNRLHCRLPRPSSFERILLRCHTRNDCSLFSRTLKSIGMRQERLVG